MPNRTVDYAYDNNGNRLSSNVVDTSGAWHSHNYYVSHGYDNDNRITSKSKMLGDLISEVSTYEYDANSNLTALSLTLKKGLPPAPLPENPEETLVTFAYQYDELDRQTSVQNAAGETFSAVYDRLGNMTEIHYPDGSASVRSFDNENRINSVTNDHPISNPPHIVYDYTYDAAENFTTVKCTPPDVAPSAYTYDELNRLVGDESSHVQFNYDSVGNKLKDTYVHPGVQTEVNYTYNSAHQLLKRTPGIYTSPYVDYEYDQNGNNSRKYIPPEDPYSIDYDYRSTYNAMNRLLSYRNVSEYVDINDLRFSYDADNELFFGEQKVDYREWNVQSYASTFYGYESGVCLYENITDCTYSEDQNLYYNIYHTLKYYTYLNGLKVGLIDVYPNQSYYNAYDGQGNIVQVSNRVGEMPYSLWNYTSYGQGWTVESNGYAPGATYKGYDSGPLGYKTGVRHYDNETGRFISPDPFKGYMEDPQSQNPYIYCQSNPIKWSDPSGYYRIDKTAAKYSQLVALLNNLYSIAKNDPKIWAALKRWGGFKDKELEETLKMDSGPLVKVVKMPKTKQGEQHGEYKGRKGDKRTIHLNQGDVELLQNASKKDTAALMLYMEAKTYHETTHYGDFIYAGDRYGLNKTDPNYKFEEGQEFEVQAYGSWVFSPSHAGTVLQQLQEAGRR
jgi:RHS repeat-associated protein